MGESLARTLATISDVMNRQYRLDGNQHKWFISFGTLLYYLRDWRLGKPFDQDIDISVFYGEVTRDELVANFAEYGFVLVKEVLSDASMLPFQMVFESDGSSGAAPSIDIFFWFLSNHYAWHTYDFHNSGKKFPEEYVFKATPKELLLADTIDYVWEEIAPPLKFPTRYGALLDTWYPPEYGQDGKPLPNTGWFFANRQFGQSRTPKMKVLTTCKNLSQNLE